MMKGLGHCSSRNTLSGVGIVKPDATELRWTYTPEAFVEEGYSYRNSEFGLEIADGQAIATLAVAQDPIDADCKNRIQQHVADLFAVQRVLTQQSVELSGPTIQYHYGDKTVIPLSLAVDVGCGTDIGRLECIVRNERGDVVSDSRADRVAQQTANLDSLTPRLSSSPVLRTIIASYEQALRDSADELVHLYEIRDALSTHYGSEGSARQSLGVSKGEWRRFGELTNHLPLTQGRHRGNHSGALRSATPEELREARSIAKSWILAFATSV